MNSAVVAAPISHTSKAEMSWTFDGDTQQKIIVDAIHSAKSTIEIAIFSLTDPAIVFALREAHKKGLHVRIITDRMQAYSRTQNVAMQILNKVGIPIKLNKHSGLMHLKMIIVDRSQVITGSYNFSKSANKVNDELLMVVVSDRFVNSCLNEFGLMWNDSGRFERLSM
jgi:phosphatidylserine/phosphatidylglycerophosphate/cardiolipin synthase-like enzyme